MRNKLRGLTLVEAILVLILLVAVVGLLAPFSRNARGPARRSSCLNNLKQISLAILNYEEANGHLPPAYTVDEHGKRLHSWRTLILPYMEGDRLHEIIDFNKPWNDPANSKAREIGVPAYVCPSYSSEDENLTTYLAVVSENSAFTGSEPQKLDVHSEEAANLITVIDAPSAMAVHWMSPEDITPEEVLALGDDTQWQHRGVFQAAFLNGRGHYFPHDTSERELRKVLTLPAAESVEAPAAESPE